MSFVQISHSGREDACGPRRNGTRLRQLLIVNCNRSVNKSHHPILNLLLLVIELWTRDNIYTSHVAFEVSMAADYSVPGCNAMKLRDRLMFWRNISPPYSGSKSKPNKKPAEADSKLCSACSSEALDSYTSQFMKL
jgi:hypothetical protein